MPALNKIKTLSGSGDILGLIVGILVFGSIWGLVEAILGGALHLIHFPYQGAIPGAIGMSIMATFVVIYRRPRLVLWTGVIAALFKLLSAAIYGQPVFAPFVINPASAIILEALAFTMVVSLLFEGFESSIRMRIGAGVAAGYLSIILYAILASAVGMGKWASLGISERVTTALTDGTALAVAGTALLFLGYLAGMRLRPRFWHLSSTKPSLFYASTTAATVCCLIGATVVSAPGLW